MQSLVGHIIDNYKILEILGHGGMGIVYKAMDLGLERIVALKMIDPRWAQDKSFLKKFQYEAKALARLHDPNIVEVYAFRETPEGFLLVMEYVEGENLVQKLLAARGPLPLEKTFPLFKQMLSAISHAHQVRVIHLDIKPGNVMITSQGVVKVMDFGLAKVKRSDESTLTQTRGTAGTLRYMSPEQVSTPTKLDHRSDVYSLGMVFFEMLTGRTPFKEDSGAFTIMKAIVESEFPSPLQFNPALPKPLARIVQRALEKDPTRRYQTCEEMLDSVEKVEAEFRKAIRPTPLPKQWWKKPAFLVPACSVVTLIVLALLFDPFRSMPQSDTKKVEATASLSIVTEPGGAEVFLDGKKLGNSPILDYQMNIGTVNLRAHKQDYFALDTTILINENRNWSFTFALRQQARAAIRVTPSDAEVKIDGKAVAPEDLGDLRLTVGTHGITISRPGFEAKEERFTLEPGRKDLLAFRLNKINIVLVTGSIKVTSEPPGASIYVDGQQRGTTPRSLQNLSAGAHRVLIKMPGFADYTTNVTVAPQEKRKVHGQLAALVGNLSVLIIPWGSIFIDGELRRENTDIQYVTELPAGLHRVKLTHPDFGVWEKEVMIEPAITQKIRVDLTKKPE